MLATARFASVARRSGRSRQGDEDDKSRSVRLLAPLADDLAAWRIASGNPSDAALIFPRADGRAGRRATTGISPGVFRKAARAARVDIGSPYDLRHSAASLWLHEGINAVQVAAWMGHSPAMLLGTYAHVIAESTRTTARPLWT